MHKLAKAPIVTALFTVGLLGYAFCTAAAATDTLNGKVLGGGQPIANSTVTLWAASEGAPPQLGQTRTGVDGSFTLSSTDAPNDATLYLIAKGGQPQANAQGGDNPAIALMTVIGGNLPGDCHNQRDDHRGFGVDPRAIPRRLGDQGAFA